jgi:hypothetical protein
MICNFEYELLLVDQKCIFLKSPISFLGSFALKFLALLLRTPVTFSGMATLTIFLDLSDKLYYFFELYDLFAKLQIKHNLAISSEFGFKELFYLTHRKTKSVGQPENLVNAPTD